MCVCVCVYSFTVLIDQLGDVLSLIVMHVEMGGGLQFSTKIFPYETDCSTYT